MTARIASRRYQDPDPDAAAVRIGPGRSGPPPAPARLHCPPTRTRRPRVSTPERAVAIAAEAHAGRTDRTGEPCLLHPLRVMLCVDTEHERIAGVLHDVVEDAPVTLEDLAADDPG